MALIRLHLRCFSHLKEAFGRSEIVICLPSGSDAAALEKEVRGMLPKRLHDMVFRLAVNQTFAAPDTALDDGDEVALLPPMQGG